MSCFFIAVFAISGLTTAWLPVSSAASGSPITNLKALMVTSLGDFYSSPYDQQIATELMRSWGVPFDTAVASSLTDSTFWDSVNQVNRYQFVVFFGSTAFATEPNYTPTVKQAVLDAIREGTNIIFVGPSVKNWNFLFGLSNLADCPTSPQGGGTCGGTLEFGVKSAFSGIQRGDPSWASGGVWSTSGRGLPDVAMPTDSWNGTGTLFMNATANNVFHPNTVFRKYGANQAMIWWWGGTEGSYSFYRQGWPFSFNNAQYGTVNSGSSTVDQWSNAFQIPVELFYYALQNVTKYDVRLLPWSMGGSAEVIRAADHESICQYTDCAGSGSGTITTLKRLGLKGEVNVNLNGWSDSIAHAWVPGTPPGSTNIPPSCITSPSGFVYNTRLPADWGNRFALLCAMVDNMTATTNSGTFTSITSNHGVFVSINDGNTTEVTNVHILISTSATPSWTLSLIDSRGNTLWTSPTQTSPKGSPTWVQFNGINARGGLKGYVNDLQGTDVLLLTVTSGTVKWYNQSPSQADYTISGRSNWDVTYIDATQGATRDFSGALPMTPDQSIRMANGLPYKQANATVWIHLPGLLHAADVVGENNPGAPSSSYFEDFFNATAMSLHGHSSISNFWALRDKGWIIESNGWTHAKDIKGSVDDDFVWANGTIMSGSMISKRVTLITEYLDKYIGAGNWTFNWAFGTSAQSYYPAKSQLAAIGIWYAELAQVDSTTGSYPGFGYFRRSGTGGGSIFDAPQGDKTCPGGVPPCSFATFNQTRDQFGVLETHSDMNYPYNDFQRSAIVSMRWNQKYDIGSTWFCGTTVRCFGFWNASSYLLQNVQEFQWASATKTITIVAYTSSSRFINNATLGDPLVFRTPQNIQGNNFNSAADNQSAGKVTNSTAKYSYYEVDSGKGWTSIVFTYGQLPTTTTTTTTTTTSTSGKTTSTSSTPLTTTTSPATTASSSTIAMSTSTISTTTSPVTTTSAPITTTSGSATPTTSLSTTSSASSTASTTSQLTTSSTTSSTASSTTFSSTASTSSSTTATSVFHTSTTPSVSTSVSSRTSTTSNSQGSSSGPTVSTIETALIIGAILAISFVVVALAVSVERRRNEHSRLARKSYLA